MALSLLGEAGRSAVSRPETCRGKNTNFRTGKTLVGPGSVQDMKALLQLGGCGN